MLCYSSSETGYTFENGGYVEANSDDAYEDIEDRKHVVTGPRQDGMYYLNGGQLHTVQLSEDGEKTVEKELRDYLVKSLPEEMLTNGLGVVQPIADFKCHALAQLQAKLWADVPKSQSANMPKLSTSANHDALVRRMIKTIAEKLARGKQMTEEK
jgi:hypothetical protein